MYDEEYADNFFSTQHACINGKKIHKQHDLIADVRHPLATANTLYLFLLSIILSSARSNVCASAHNYKNTNHNLTQRYSIQITLKCFDYSKYFDISKITIQTILLETK